MTEDVVAMCHTLARTYKARHPAAEFDELLSSAAFGALKALARYDGSVASVQTFCSKRALGQMVDDHRTRTGFRRKTSARLVPMRPEDWERGAVDDRLDAVDVREQVQSMLRNAELTDRQRVALFLRYVDGLKLYEVGAAIGVGESRAKTILSEALEVVLGQPDK